MEYVIDLPENRGLRWQTQYFHTPHKMKPMTIPGCQRCLGIVIFWECRNDQNSFFAITAAHLGPSDNRKNYRQNRNEFLKKLKRHYELEHVTLRPYLIFAAGGLINTPAHKTFYSYSLHYYLKPFLQIFPGVQIVFEEATPESRQTDIHIRADGTLKTVHWVETS